MRNDAWILFENEILKNSGVDSECLDGERLFLVSNDAFGQSGDPKWGGVSSRRTWWNVENKDFDQSWINWNLERNVLKRKGEDFFFTRKNSHHW